MRQQLEHLADHPPVARALAKGRIQLIGMFFDIGTAEVYMADTTGRFTPVEDTVALAAPH